jgi:hypothetical protein
MEKWEIEQLQEYLNLHKQNKKITVMPYQDFYVAEHDTTGEFVSGLDENQEPTFSADIDEAEWSFNESTVEGLINRFGIADVKPKVRQGSNHPPKPPING